jgi:uncharacterized protein (TIGR03083 family)
VELTDYVSQLQSDTDLLLRATDRAGLAAAVPSCAGWDVLKLLTHLTRVHHWSAAILSGANRESFSFESPDQTQIKLVVEEGVSTLSAAIRAVPPGRSVWTMFGDLPPAMFWARRQAHETAIHRVDGELAAGLGVSEIDSAFAIDGIDELLVGMLPNRVTGPIGRPFVVTVAPLDANAGWTVSFGPDGVATRLGAVDAADLTAFGMAPDLYRWLWNRAGDDEVSLRGDLALADTWHQHVRIGSR